MNLVRVELIAKYDDNHVSCTLTHKMVTNYFYALNDPMVYKFVGDILLIIYVL